MKELIKRIFFTLAALAIAPITLLYLVLKLIFNRDGLFSGFSQALSLLPGKVGGYLRAGFYRFTMTSCASNAVLSFATLFSQQDTEIGNGVYIGPQGNIGKCKINQNALIGSGVHILSGKKQHNFTDLNTPIKDQGGCFEKVTIGEGAWIGNGAIIMASIGQNAVVAAGAVVIDDVADFDIVAGNPAKKINSRKPN